MWFKKKSVLQAENHYNTEKSADNTTDIRTTFNAGGYENTNRSINSGVPSVADANKYFYLPALGYYNAGQLFSVGDVGFYWSSSASPRDYYKAYRLYFESARISMFVDNRYYGPRAEAFQ